MASEFVRNYFRASNFKALMPHNPLAAVRYRHAPHPTPLPPSLKCILSQIVNRTGCFVATPIKTAQAQVQVLWKY